jgi:hypothetical protein
LNDCGLLPNINPVEGATVAKDCPLNFNPSAERFLWVNQLCFLKVILVFIGDGGKKRAVIELRKNLLGSFRKKKLKVSFGQRTVFVPVHDRINRGRRKSTGMVSDGIPTSILSAPNWERIKLDSDSKVRRTSPILRAIKVDVAPRPPVSMTGTLA